MREAVYNSMEVVCPAAEPPVRFEILGGLVCTECLFQATEHCLWLVGSGSAELPMFCSAFFSIGVGVGCDVASHDQSSFLCRTTKLALTVISSSSRLMTTTLTGLIASRDG